MTLQQIYERLFERYGEQHWWPGETVAEIIIGAVLTQNTNWKNVEKAIDNLKRIDTCRLDAIRDMQPDTLAELIRPAGYFNVKTKRLQAVANGLDPNVIKRMPVEEVRKKLLDLHGVGPETADSILLYAFDKATFVVDAYTKRIFSRLGIVEPNADYETVRAMFQRELPVDVKLYNEYHALIVRHAKEHCRVRPQCAGCVLKNECHL